MPSYDYGKEKVCQWIRDNFPPGSEILDVGACDGKWRELLPEYVMDAVEIYKPYAEKLTGYRYVFCMDAVNFEYQFYDMILFGDVVEHMTVADAQKVIRYAQQRCKDMVVAVPFEYVQGPVDGNRWQAHIQDDLTPEVFRERYPGLSVLYNTGRKYCYYHRGAT